MHSQRPYTCVIGAWLTHSEHSWRAALVQRASIGESCPGKQETMLPEIQPQDIDRVLHGSEDLMQMTQYPARKDHFQFSMGSYEPMDDIVRGMPFPDNFDDLAVMQGFVPLGTSTPDIARPMMRAPLSGSTGSGDATGEGSRDASTLDRDYDSDEGRTLSGSTRVTGLRSARRRAKRQAHLDETDDYSDEGGSPAGHSKRVQANRLSAQRSRQRKLEREAQLTRDVEELGQELAQLAAQEDMLRREEGKLAQQVQTCEHELAVVRNRILTMRAENARMQQECDHILDQHPHLRDEKAWMQLK
ncbi:hypothetical protein CVIRNUC_010037 [Coccomyxa viridis]|uniref:BZIP domain-containing protein n=1 Tax=Coccomyxa viridis TaxID=1274662 RepID=A0AAV1ILK3_9CHLO|nr:hypothetical protein CVIRNUC_010037 [Coccomyxa viridis]